MPPATAMPRQRAPSCSPPCSAGTPPSRSREASRKRRSVASSSSPSPLVSLAQPTSRRRPSREIRADGRTGWTAHVVTYRPTRGPWPWPNPGPCEMTWRSCGQRGRRFGRCSSDRTFLAAAVVAAFFLRRRAWFGELCRIAARLIEKACRAVEFCCRFFRPGWRGARGPVRPGCLRVKGIRACLRPIPARPAPKGNAPSDIAAPG